MHIKLPPEQKKRLRVTAALQNMTLQDLVLYALTHTLEAMEKAGLDVAPLEPGGEV